MALLALTLALLAMTVATTAIEEKLLDMAPDSFDDQYQKCRRIMEDQLPTMNISDSQKNSLFSQVWPKAVAEWQRRGSSVSPLSSPGQAIAIMAYTMGDLYKEFNKKVREAGHSRQEYWDNFHFKTLHFLLTDALATLGDSQKGKKCHFVLRGVKNKLFKAQPGAIIRFGQFASSTLRENIIHRFGTTTVFKVQTCHGAYIKAFSYFPNEEEVLIPPFEKFNVTKVIKDGEKVQIHLDSIGTYSKYNCEWLRGGSVPRVPCHLAGLLLATTALAMATGIL
ncbi:NAD(P)(+)--arginine ADP-ribosyltransferase 2 [Turdus rufiventris]|nr:NAD(P)(+)--arginine ADP-ribosyltransferase 2 [Turdus rufiventris]